MTDQSIVNFSAGPAILPKEVLKQAQSELIDWSGGMSVLEMSHRSESVLALKDSLDNLLRELLVIPDNFTILMMHGGARGQFSAVPMNLAPKGSKASYLLTGYWGRKAAQSAKALIEIESLTPDCSKGLAGISHLALSSESHYLHVTDNETIEGIEIFDYPKVHCPIVTDVTSSILSKNIDWTKVHCVYASAQKNLGIAGATFVILRNDLMDINSSVQPDILSYKTCHEFDSMYNTPPVFAWYMAEKVLRWVKDQGGVTQMQQRAHLRSEALYRYIDSSDLFENTVHPQLRSRMNVPFQIKVNEQGFFKAAKQHGLLFLEGHRSVGGARASLYNAMPLENVERLIAFMKDFEQRNT